jgi:S-adenosylmethionine:tRNA ribosyltransferase-isomerase
MRIEEFDYNLPRSLIAQYPSSRREESRLMVLRKNEGAIEHRVFREIPEFFRAGDLLVMNNTRVLPVRLIGKKESGGKCEILLIPPPDERNGEWDVLVKGSGRIKEGARIHFGRGIDGEIKSLNKGRGKVMFSHPEEIPDLIREIGHIPLPPYIKRGDEPLDKVRYQTVYAERDGSIAAPTAGLHFTESLLQSIRGQGVNVAWVTLHIGVGTFAPVKAGEVEDHRMDSEWLEISPETADAIEATKRRGGRVIAVGTTSTRSLESFADGEGRVRSGKGLCSLFIYPPFRFRIIDGLITNFHLPKSTLVMLACAFAGKDLLLRAYEEAVEKKYRFYSYGDAMLIL